VKRGGRAAVGGDYLGPILLFRGLKEDGNVG